MVWDYSEHLKGLGKRKPHIMGHESAFKSAVLLPLVKREGEDCILFEERALSLDHQPGEICFPGGQIDAADKNPEQAAIRETCEELGLTPAQVKVIGPLDIMVSPFNLIVYPFVGRLDAQSVFNYNPDEVESLFCVPVDYLLNFKPQRANVKLEVKLPTNYPLDMIPGGRDYPWRHGRYPQVFYEWQGRIIWGLTARILEHFLILLQQGG